MQRISQREFNRLQRDVKDILVKKFGGIGNVILGTPMLQALKSVFPNADTTVLVQSEGAKEVLEGSPYVQKVLIIPFEKYKRGGRHRYLSQMLSLALDLRGQKYDLVVNSYGGFGGDSWMSCLYSFLTGGKYTIGYGKSPWSLLYYKSLKVEGEVHEVERNLGLIRSITPENHETAARLNLWISEHDREEARKALDSWGISGNDLVIGTHPGSGPLAFKRWCPDKFALLFDQMIKKWDARIIVFGGRDEMQLADSILDNMEESPVNMVGKTSLGEMAAIIEKCRIFVSNDTGPMHVAAAMQVPVVAIFGPTNFYRTSPYGIQHAIVKSDLSCVPCYRGDSAKCDELLCLDRISVDHVLRAVQHELYSLCPG